MTGIIAANPTLSDSTFKSRPETSTFYRSDTNAGLTSASQYKEEQRRRLLKYATINKNFDAKSITRLKTGDASYKKYNDEGDNRVAAPYRSVENFIDPISGFISASGDIVRNTNHYGVGILIHENEKPNYCQPNTTNSIRKGKVGAPPDTRRQTVNDPGAPYKWNSRVMLDATIRSELGGWTSKSAPNLRESKSKDEEARDQLINNYRYKSSTQAAFEDVKWDNFNINKRRWKPTTTYETQADWVWPNAEHRTKPKAWQSVGDTWDKFQTRQVKYKENVPIPGINFCTRNPKVKQIPGYSGCVSGTCDSGIDDRLEKYKPLTVKRSTIPRPSQTSHREHIPGYAGCTLYKSSNTSENFSSGLSTYPDSAGDTNNKRKGEMSRSITLVAPSNPFNSKKKEMICY